MRRPSATVPTATSSSYASCTESTTTCSANRCARRGANRPPPLAALFSPPPRLRCAGAAPIASPPLCSQGVLPRARFRAQRMEMPSLLDLRLRRDLSNTWNSWVVGFHAEASRWL